MIKHIFTLIFSLTLLFITTASFASCCPGSYCGPYTPELRTWIEKNNPTCTEVNNHVWKERVKAREAKLAKENKKLPITLKAAMSNIKQSPKCPGPCCPSTPTVIQGVMLQPADKYNDKELVEEAAAQIMYDYCAERIDTKTELAP